jgi:glutamate N-acetyltransferase/amino-acid N-acetyltransferase
MHHVRAAAARSIRSAAGLAKALGSGHSMKTDEMIVQGFEASAVAAGLKKDGTLDMGLIFSKKEAAAAGVFTANRVKAAPVVLSKEHLKNGRARAIIANAGNANACTGRAGLDNASKTAEMVAGVLDVEPHNVLVASTGVIGQPLDMDRVGAAIPRLAATLSARGLAQTVRAIMTTDSFPKTSLFEGQTGGRRFKIAGIAKGAGMIMPNMATMLCFILSDIRIDPADLKKALLTSAEATFNRITVDGDTSTNDMVLALANGLAGNSTLSEEGHSVFMQGLQKVMGDLARMIVKDGEGATKLIDVQIRGAVNSTDALIAARTVANSSLVKTAFYGQDPNWGRIMAALGRSGILMEEDRVDIWIDSIKIVSSGLGKGFEQEKKAAEAMAKEEFTLTIDLGQGPYQTQMLTCDLTHRYVTINADYRT